MNKLLYTAAFIALFSTICSCKNDENEIHKGQESAQNITPNETDEYLQSNFQDKYRCAVRWRWNDNLADISYIVTPIQEKMVKPVGEMVKHFWIEPFLLESTNGAQFIRKNFPPELIFIGSPIRNADGTRILGYAEAGVRITLSELDQYDLKDKRWLEMQLSTMHHEFTHIVHQTYNMPEGYNKISEGRYTGNSWKDMSSHAMQALMHEHTNEEGYQPSQEDIEEKAIMMAITHGMVTPYGTMNEHEDFAELVSHYLLKDPKYFETTYLKPNAKHPELNEGKQLIKAKVNMTLEYYNNKFGIDLNHLRDIIQKKLAANENN